MSIDKWMDKDNTVCVCIYIYMYTPYIYINIYIYVMYIQWNITQPQKQEWNFAICSNLDGLGGHYAKSNKSDRERQILHDITYMWNLKNTEILNDRIEQLDLIDIFRTLHPKKAEYTFLSSARGTFSRIDLGTKQA